MKIKISSFSLLPAFRFIFTRTESNCIKQKIAGSGSLNLVENTIYSKYSINKLSDYDSLNMSFTGNWGFGQSYLCILQSDRGYCFCRFGSRRYYIRRNRSLQSC